MGILDTHDAVESRFKTQWEAGPNTAKSYMNVDFDPSTVEEFVRININEGQTFFASLGDGNKVLHRHTGLIVIQIFIKSNTNARRAKELQDLAIPIFNNTKFSGIQCNESSPFPVGKSGDKKQWYQVNVNTPFEWDECK